MPRCEFARSGRGGVDGVLPFSLDDGYRVMM